MRTTTCCRRVLQRRRRRPLRRYELAERFCVCMLSDLANCLTRPPPVMICVQSAQVSARTATKPSIGDLSYIKNWAPERLGGNAKPAQPATSAATTTKAPATQKQPRSTSTFVAGFGMDSRHHDRIQLPSPKRLQIDAGVPLVNRGVESSPLSVSSVSSTSSPPLISDDSKMVKDPFGSLTSKVMVSWMTMLLSWSGTAG